ncbi:unnamed protein product [Leptidea sinapis]|uniref:Uncharacterized protein n=1 Tax=Leptidea sinapis TaxID=189913 RepID=A0A5E4QC47_9NEOP|nr:unnamed protein product [Leptidea sinapis]
MYKVKVKVPKAYGQCDKKTRGNVLYKDNTEITVNKNFGQGFFFLSMAQAAEVLCGTIQLQHRMFRILPKRSVR